MGGLSAWGNGSFILNADNDDIRGDIGSETPFLNWIYPRNAKNRHPAEPLFATFVADMLQIITF
jgi:hypothetical protein